MHQQRQWILKLPSPTPFTAHQKLMIDLRSDTVTQPTAAMRQAMADAEVGDAVLDIDPTVQKLEAMTSEFLGTEDAIFMPSGTMTNQVALRIHCKPGDDFLCEEYCHIYNWEQGAFAQLSGLVARTVLGKDGIFDIDDLVGKVRQPSDHCVGTKLVCLENTHNRGGGRIWPLEQLESVCRWARSHELACHLDGARLFNAVAQTGIEAWRWAGSFDSVSVCFSKGLGAPIGSALAGSREFIEEARRARKLFGGGMRQAGIIAAGALHALQHHRSRLIEDHENARLLGKCLRELPGIMLEPDQIDSNIVVFRLPESTAGASVVVDALKANGLLALSISANHVRLVTHLDVDRAATMQACEMLSKTLVQPELQIAKDSLF